MTEQPKPDEGELETRKSLAEGHGITFSNAKEAIEWLKSGAMTKEELVEKIADIIDLKSIVTSDRKRQRTQKEENYEYANQIYALIKKAGYFLEEAEWIGKLLREGWIPPGEIVENKG